MSKYKKYGRGWYNESRRHSLARQGIKTKELARKKIMHELIFGVKSPRDDLGISKVEEEKIRSELIHGVGYAKKKEDYFNIRTSSPMQADKLHDKLTKAGISSFIYDWGNNKLVTVNKKYKDKVKKLLKIKKINFQKLSQHPQHILNAPLPDKDKDRVPDIYDWDDDNDGVPDWKDTEGMFSIDRFKGKGVFDPFHDSQVDSDFDGVPDVKDLHPLNPHKARDWAKTNYAKPEIVGQQLRIRVQSPKKFEKFRTQDIGRKGFLHRLAGYDEDTGKWQTQSWRLNLSDYKDYGTVAKTIQGLRISPKLKTQSLKQAKRYFSKRL